MSKKKLIQIFVAIFLGGLAGYITGDKAVFIPGVTFYQIYNLIGQLFLNALMLVVVPLVTASIISGTARMGSEKSMGTLGVKTFALFLGTTGIALLIGWILAVVLEPGALTTKMAEVNPKALEIASQVDQGAFSKIEQILFRIIPSNIIATAAQGQMLGLIFFSLLFGFFLAQIESEPSRILINVVKGIFQVMLKITELVMKALPIGVFGLVAKVVATTGLESIVSVAYFFFTMILGLLIFMFGALNPLLRFLGHVKPFAHLRAMWPALLTAFTTSSSVATLPVAIDCLEKRSGVSNRITSFSFPLGTSINLSGSSLQVIVSVFFIAQVYGIPLSITHQVLIFFMAWILSLGVAGIPSAALFSIVIILTTMGLPADGIGLIMAVERLLDMCRTTVNVYSNSCCAVILARSEGEVLPIQLASH